MTMNPKKVSLPSPSHRERVVATIRRRRIPEYWEMLYPWVFGLAAGVGAFQLPVDKTTFGNLLKDAAPAAISVAAIFAGFQGAIHAILLSMLRSRVVRNLKRSGSYDRLIGFIRSGILSLTVFVAVSLLAVFLNALNLWSGGWAFATAALIGLFTHSLMSSVRVMMLEVAMLQVPDDDAPLPG
jgi:hypothetical protein